MNHNEILHIWRQHCQWQRPIEDHHATTRPHNEYIMFQCYMYFSRQMYNYLPFYILEKDDFAMVHPVGIRFVHLAMVWWLSSLPTAPWLASSGASGSYQWGLVSKPVYSASPINWQQPWFFPFEQCITAVTKNRLPAAGFYFCVRHIVYNMLMARDYVITSQYGRPAFARARAGAGFSNRNQDSLWA